MQLGIFAKTFTGSDPRTVLGAARAAGYDAVQYNLTCSGLAAVPDSIPAGTAEAIREAAARTEVAVVAISATYNMIHPDPAVRQRGHAALRHIADVARAVGAPLLTLCTGTRDPNDQWRDHPDNASPEAWDDLLESMAIASAIAESADVELGIEPELANVVNSAERALQLFDAIASPRLKIVLDPANLFEVEPLGRQHGIVADGIRKLAGRIALAHAKDRDAAGGFATAGTGVLDYRFYLQQLQDAGFDGPLVTHGLTAPEAPAVAAFLAERLSELRPAS